MRRYLKVFSLAAVLALAAAACGGGGGGNNNQGGGGANAITPGGTIQAALISDVSAAFDPQKEYYSVTWEFYRCCLLRTLLSYNGKTTDEGGTELHPDLATAMPEISADQLTWTFTLKQGVHYSPPFQDVEVTSGDIARALLRESNPKANVNGYSFYYSVIDGFGDAAKAGDKATGISGVETPDDHTLVVHVTAPTGDLGYRFALPATAPIPPALSGDAPLGAADGHDADYGRFLVATGPYMFRGTDALDFSQPADQQTPVAGYVPEKSIELVRNPSWDKSTDDLRLAYPDGFQISIGGDVNDLYNKIDAGQLDLDIDSGPPPQFLQKYTADPALSKFLHANPSDAVRYISFNLAEPPFDDVHIRKAFNLAINKEGIRKVRGGPMTGEIGTHIMVNSLENNALGTYDPYATPNSAGDVDKAKAEIALSKYDTNQDGVCDAPECKNILAVSDQGSPYPQQAAIVTQNLEPLGIQLDVKAFERTTMYTKCNDPSAHVAVCLGPGWGKDYPDGFTFAGPLFDSTSNYPSCCNYSLVGADSSYLSKYNYSVTTVQNVNDAIATCAAKTGPDRPACWADFDKMLMEEVVPWAPYLFDTAVEYTSQRVNNYSFDQFAGLYALDQLAIEKSAQ